MIKSKEARIIVFVCLLYLGVLAIPISGIFTCTVANDQLLRYLDGIAKALILIVVGHLLIRRNRLSDLAGISFNRFNYSYLVIAPLLLLSVIFFLNIGTDLNGADPFMAFLLFTKCILLGISEELFFRGIVQSLLLRKLFERGDAVTLSITYSALIFSGMHLSNIIRLGGIPLDQLIYTFFAGIYLGSLLLLTGQLVPLGILHGMVNFLFAFNDVVPSFQKAPPIADKPVFEQVVSLLLITIFFSPLLLIGIWQMKKINKEDLRPLLKD